MNIETRVESKRGCGFRKGGGKYLVSGGSFRHCDLFPLELTVCPACHAGIHPTRGWTWIDPKPLLQGRTCSDILCPFNEPPERVGLLWIGEKFYATPDAFMKEAAELGISRRLHQIPRDFKVGETWAWLAHRKAITNLNGTFTAGVFQAFRPDRIEYVVKDTETPEELESLEKRGFTLVRVIPKDSAYEARNRAQFQHMMDEAEIFGNGDFGVGPGGGANY